MQIGHSVASLKDGVIKTCIGNDEDEPGYYDMVFVYDGTAFAKLYIRIFYNELINKSDAELEKLIVQILVFLCNKKGRLFSSF